MTTKGKILEPVVREQPVEATIEPVETEKERLQRETEEAELRLKHRKATKLLDECQSCEATKIANKELASSLAEKEAELAEGAIKVSAIVAKNTEILAKITEAKTQVKKEAEEVARTKAINDKAKNWAANLLATLQADNTMRDLLTIERYIDSRQSAGVIGTQRDLQPEFRAYNRIKTLLTEGKDIDKEGGE